MDKLLSKTELAELLGCGVGTVDKKVSRREWPFTWVGRKVKFTPAQVEQIVSLGEQPALTGPLAVPQSPRLRSVTGPRPPAGPSTPPPPSGPATPSKRRGVAA